MNYIFCYYSRCSIQNYTHGYENCYRYKVGFKGKKLQIMLLRTILVCIFKNPLMPNHLLFSNIYWYREWFILLIAKVSVHHSLILILDVLVQSVDVLHASCSLAVVSPLSLPIGKIAASSAKVAIVTFCIYGISQVDRVDPNLGIIWKK